MFPRLSQVVKKLIIALGVAYVAQLILENWLRVDVTNLLALTPGGGGLWQLLTYVLVDPYDPLMFLIRLVLIWWALSPFEIGYGPERTLQLCLVSILGSGLAAYIVGAVVPGSPQLFGSQTIWYGGIAATTWLRRDQVLSWFGVLNMAAKHFLWLLLGLSVLMFLWSKNHTQLVAELAAIASGIAFVRYMKRPRRPKRSDKPAPRSSGFKVIQGGIDDDRPKWLN